MKTYLIARAKIEERDYKKGFDSIVNLDYMGASEYEWGAIPESLARIRKNINDYTYLDIPIKNLSVTVFCHNDNKSDVNKYLTELASGKMRTKNGNHFDWYVQNEKKSDFTYVRDRVNFWWDIENDLMFWIKSPDFEIKFKDIIKVKPE
jgi:hypothetical protein